MKTRTTFFFLLIILCLGFGPPASAQFFNSGSINGNLNAFFIDGPGGPFGESISDEFVSVATGRPGDVNFGEWTLGGAPTVVNWSLGTTSFGSDLGRGGGAVTSTFLGTDGFGYGIYNTQVRISISGSGELMAGHTYYFTLSGANDSSGSQFDAWDDNESTLASCYFENPNGSGGCPTTESESFTVTGCGGDRPNCGPPPGTPEPSTVLLFGSGILGLAGVLRRRLNF